ncbi:helix-turn-helix domain-containing protein [Achromobacter xylosoxidans]
MGRAGRGPGVAGRDRGNAGALCLAGQLSAAGGGAAHLACAGGCVRRGRTRHAAGGHPWRTRTAARAAGGQPAGDGRRRDPRGAGRARGNVSAAARALGVHRSTLYRRAAALGLARPR